MVRFPAISTRVVPMSRFRGHGQVPLDALADELGDRSFPLTCDLADKEATASLPQRAAEAMGGLDILVNNAGITRDSLMMRMSESDWTRSFRSTCPRPCD